MESAMSERVLDSATTTLVRKSILADLAIHEFDQWTNPKNSILAPTTMCWCQHDISMEPAK
jgi:hypothetical protein